MWKTRLTVLAAFLIATSLVVYWRLAVYPFLELTPGHIEAFTLSIRPDAAGRISEMGPQEGDSVQRGELLFALDRALLMAQKQQIEASCQQLQEQIRSEQERVQKALEAYLSEIATPEDAQRHLSTMEEAQIKIEAAKAELAPLQTQYNAIHLQISSRASIAPFDGIVLKRAKPLGALVPEGEEVYRLADPQKVWVETSLAETELVKVAIGMKARVRLPAYPGKEWKGVVSWIGPTASEEEQRVGVRISIDRPDVRLKPGLSAEATLRIR